MTYSILYTFIAGITMGLFGLGFFVWGVTTGAFDETEEAKYLMFQDEDED
jgi:cbb3-type cytochrome oxidase maturation protein